MSKAVSFTEGNAVRYPVPDVARGFMLILIALANIGVWAAVIPSQVQSSALDAIFTVLRVGLIDQRAYPLFSMLFGFGLMVMVQRRRAQYMGKARASMGALDPATTHPAFMAAQEQSFMAAAMVDARRLLRRRGWWMLLFGAVHALIFPGDIIGSYAIVALIFAGLVVAEKPRTMIIIGAFPMVIGAFAMAGKAFIPEGTEQGTLLSVEYTPLTPLIHVGTWGVTTGFSLLLSNIIVAAGIGVYLAKTDYLTHPEQHRRFLGVSAVLGLSVAFVVGLPAGMAKADLLAGGLQWWMYTLAAFGGLPGAWGWLSLIALLTGPAPTTGGLRGIRWVLSAVGRRSMTAYLLQSVSFLAIFATVNALGWPVSETSNVLLAWATWLLIAALCVALEYAGKRGPFEVLLRSAVASTGKPVPVPPVLLPPTAPGMQRVPVIPRPYPQPGQAGSAGAYPMTPPMGEQMPYQSAVSPQAAPAQPTQAQGAPAQPAPAQSAPAQTTSARPAQAQPAPQAALPTEEGSASASPQEGEPGTWAQP